MTSEANLALTADQQAVAKKKIRDIHGAISTIFSLLEEGKPVDAELATNCVKVAEFNLSDLCKSLGVETFSAAEREKRYADLRAANIKIRDLETQLGATLSPQATQHAIKNTADRLSKWWQREGFGYVHELKFGAYGVCHGEFSCSLRGSSLLFESDTPVSDRKTKAEWLTSLRERGFKLTQDGRDWVLVDCDSNRQALLDLVSKRLPSAKIFRFNSFSRDNEKGFALRNAEVYVYELAEIMALPVSAQEVDL